MPSQDGKPIYMTRAQFDECCCPPQCQWRSLFYWSCQDEFWERIVDDWVDKAQPPETVIEDGECIRIVYGLSANCDTPEEERPSLPPDFEGGPPENPLECCLPCVCPPDVLSQYSVSGQINFNCLGGSGTSIPETILISNAVAMQSFFGGCSWDVGDGNFPTHTTIKSCAGGSFNPFRSAIGGSLAGPGPCFWRFYVSINTFQGSRTLLYTFDKTVGDSPAGTYKLVSGSDGLNFQLTGGTLTVS